jgi:creatinine amidohydrolase/Fe(II)-dependent formamide hydrolase-like protein
MLSAYPALVGDAAGKPFEPILRENDAFRLPDMGASGVLGDPTTAGAGAGAAFLDAAVQGLAALLDALPTTPKENDR